MSNKKQPQSSSRIDAKWMLGTVIGVLSLIAALIVVPEVRCVLNLSNSSECPKKQQIVTSNISSPKRIDYQSLASYLETGNLKAADQETNRILRQIFDLEGMPLITKEALTKNPFPCQDLNNVDRLWSQVGDKQQFGFTPQKLIWQDLQSTVSQGEDKYSKFADRVGWRNPSNSNKYLGDGDLTYSLAAKKGHLPSAIGTGLRWNYGRFLDRLSQNCQTKSNR